VIQEEFKEWLSLPETKEVFKRLEQYARDCWWDCRGLNEHVSSAGHVMGIEDAIRYMQELGGKE
jgi:hypothetical protein